MSGTLASNLTQWGWEVAPEVSYLIYGERGSIDLLAWHARWRALLIVEVKTELVSIEATLRKHDEKVRLGPRVAAERFGWRAVVIGGVVALPSDRTQRRRVDRHAAVLERALPVRGSAVRAWMRRPSGAMSGLWFVTSTNGGRAGGGFDKRARVRHARSDSKEPAQAGSNSVVNTTVRR